MSLMKHMPEWIQQIWCHIIPRVVTINVMRHLCLSCDQIPEKVKNQIQISLQKKFAKS